MPPFLELLQICEHRLVQNDRAQLRQEFVTGGDSPRLIGYLRIGEFEPFPVALLENQLATHGLGQAPQMFGMDGHTMLIDLLGRPDDSQVPFAHSVSSSLRPPGPRMAWFDPSSSEPHVRCEVTRNQ